MAVTLVVSDGAATGQDEMKVTVQDTTAPVLTLNGAANLTIESGVETYAELGATASDACDPAVSVVIAGDTVLTAMPGVYTVTYNAADASANAATQVTRTVTVQDTTAPVITLNGAANLTIECGIGIYTEPGATAFDACDGSVTVAIGGDTVDVTSLALYTVT